MDSREELKEKVSKLIDEIEALREENEKEFRLVEGGSHWCATYLINIQWRYHLKMIELLAMLEDELKLVQGSVEKSGSGICHILIDPELRKLKP